ncbi:hypothetical protein CR513_48862, partial [Mucuna pruriens]
MLNGTNFKVWKEAVEIVMGCMDLNLALRVEEPIPTMHNLQEVKIEKWERSNRMCLMIMKHSIPEAFWGSISKNFLVHLVLISLPAHFGQFKVSYNTQKDKWSLNELISHCVQEEERLQRDKTESAYFVSTSQNNKRKKIKGAAEGSSQRKKLKKKEEFTCYFCKKSGHMKKQCPNRPPSDDERFIFVGDGNKVAVEAIGTFRLQLKTGFCLDLFETFVVPSFRRNLVSISCLDRFGFTCSFGNNKVSLYQNSNVVGSGSLIDNLYMFYVVSSYKEILQIGSRGTKQKLIKNSAIIWHKRLGHISKQRI